MLSRRQAGAAAVDEKVIPLVVDEDECREVLHFYFPDGLHAEFGVFDDFDPPDVLLGQDGGGTANAPEVESAVSFAGIRHSGTSVALGHHYQRPAEGLEEVHVAVHATRCRGAEGARGVTGGGLGGSGVVDRMILEILWQALAGIDPLLELRMGDVARDDERDRKAGRAW
jgi:hypothetical protein